MAKKRRRSKAERDAWNAHVDETVRTLREIVEKSREERRKKEEAREARSQSAPG
jgi:hypothetical protein